MKRVVIPGGWYADVAGVEGDYAVLMPDSHLETSRGRFELPGENVLYVRAALAGPTMKVCGVGGASDIAWAYPEIAPHGWKNHGLAHGVSACLYNQTAEDLFVATVITGSQGYRYLDTTGFPVTGDETYNDQTPFAIAAGVTGLWEWTQYGDLTVGQNSKDECVIVGPFGRRVLETGQCRFIRFNRVDSSLAIALWKPLENCAILHWLTTDEVELLPLENPPNPEPDPEAPTCTITSYPLSLVQGDPAVARAQYGGGPIEIVAWRYKLVSETIWITASLSTVPAPEFDYGPHFADPGSYHISLGVEGPGGAHETQRERIIDVLEADTEPEEPDMLYSEETFVEYIDASGQLIFETLAKVGSPRPLVDCKQMARGSGDRYRGNGVNATVSDMVNGGLITMGNPPLDAVTIMDPLVVRCIEEERRLQSR